MMPYRQKYGLLSLALLVILLAGCAAFEHEQVKEEKRLSINDWPTPVPTAPPATPTPFIKVTLPPTVAVAMVEATSTAVPTPDDTMTPASSAAPVSDFTDQTTLLQQATSILTERYPAVGVVVITTGDVSLRQGPGASYGGSGNVSRGEIFGVAGKSADGNWLYLFGTSQRRGWLPLEAVRFTGDLAKAPVLPADPIAGLLAEFKASLTSSGAPDAPSSMMTETGQVKPEPVNRVDLPPVTTAVNETSTPASGLAPIAEAQLNRANVDLRWGPGTEYGVIDTLTSDDTGVSILARDETAGWALVRLQTFTEDLGWIAVDDLTLDSVPDDAPVAVTARVQSNEVDVYQGPGIYESKAGVLGINSLVNVLGLDEQRSWALVQPVGSAEAGWVQVRLLTVYSPLAELPLAPELVNTTQAASDEEPEPLAPPPIAPRPLSESQLVLQRSSGGEIVVINPDGSGLRRLTSGIDPVLSPDGQTVAFTRWEGKTGSLWLIDIDGSNERQVLGFIKQAKGAEWSPDGSQIVFNFQQGGQLEPSRICTDLTQDNPARPPRNATDIGGGLDSRGEPQLCWTTPEDPYWDLRVVNLADGQFKDYDGGTYAFRPAWDPGQPWRIVTDGGRGLVAVDVNRQTEQRISEVVGDGSPVFSPDGRYLAVTTGKQGGGAGHDIYRLNRDGGGRVQLTSTPLWAPVQPDSEGKQWNNVAPAWSPDGAQIAFLTDRTGQWEIWVMNVDGSEQRPMFSDEVNDQLALNYNFVDERSISWR